MNAYNEHLFARDVSDYGAWSKRPKIPRKLKKKIYGTRRNWRNHRKYHGHPVLSFDRLAKIVWLESTAAIMRTPNPFLKLCLLRP